MEPTFREIFPNQQSEIETISILAKSILHEFYGPQMPKHHIDYFVQTFQSKEAIIEQLSGQWKYFLIEIKNIPIGYLGVSIEGDKMTLSKLYVLANQRNMGAGKGAMELVSKMAGEYGIREMELHVNQMNIRAIKFYRSFGFSIARDLTTDYASGHTEHDYVMTRRL